MFYCLVLVWPPVPWCLSNKLTFCSAHSLWHEWKNGIWGLVGISDWEVKCADDVQMLEVLMFSGGCSGCGRVMCPGSLSLSCSPCTIQSLLLHSCSHLFCLHSHFPVNGFAGVNPASWTQWILHPATHTSPASISSAPSQTFSIIAFLFLSTISCAPNTTCHFGLIF